jgi:hypothetical protein
MRTKHIIYLCCLFFFFLIKLIIDPKFLVPLFIWGPREGKDVAYLGAGPDALDACDGNEKEVMLEKLSCSIFLKKII